MRNGGLESSLYRPEHVLCEYFKAWKRTKSNSCFTLIYIINLCSCHAVPFHGSAMLTPSYWCLSLSHAEEFNNFQTL